MRYLRPTPYFWFLVISQPDFRNTESDKVETRQAETAHFQVLIDCIIQLPPCSLASAEDSRNTSRAHAVWWLIFVALENDFSPPLFSYASRVSEAYAISNNDVCLRNPKCKNCKLNAWNTIQVMGFFFLISSKIQVVQLVKLNSLH